MPSLRQESVKTTDRNTKEELYANRRGWQIGEPRRTVGDRVPAANGPANYRIRTDGGSGLGSQKSISASGVQSGSASTAAGGSAARR